VGGRRRGLLESAAPKPLETPPNAADIVTEESVVEPETTEERLVAGPRFEHTTLSTTKSLQELTARNFDKWKRAKSA